MKKILLTSFATWKPNHVSNSSDDLLHQVRKTEFRTLHYLRRIPVDFQLAPQKLLARFDELKPDVLICCGMAEEREKLNIESRAILGEETIETDVDLETLTSGLPMTEISHDAGKFVCNTLFFKALKHLRRQEEIHHCIFTHVPVLTPGNATMVKNDFLSVIDRLSMA